MLARLRKAQQENDGGFTLIELLVVVIIIGILAAIAIPTFLSQREKAWEKAALSDLRNTAVLLEEHYETGAYPASQTTAGGDIAGITEKFSEGVSLVTYVNLGAGNGYCLEFDHASIAANFVLKTANGKAAKVGTGSPAATAC